jgi:hypothetical protein
MHALMSSSDGSAPDSVSCAYVVVRGESTPEAVGKRSMTREPLTGFDG